MALLILPIFFSFDSQNELAKLGKHHLFQGYRDQQRDKTRLQILEPHKELAAEHEEKLMGEVSWVP